MSIQPNSLKGGGPFDRTVKVSFTAPDTWRFDPENVTMDGAGNVMLLRSSDGATWTFVDADITDPHGQFSTTVPTPGDRCIVRDDFKVKGNYKYVVTVRDGGTTYTSPDPEIINSGPP